MTGAPTWGPDGESLTSLLSERPRRQLDRGARLFHEGDAPSDAYVVHSGLVKLVMTADDGTEAVIEFRGPDDLVGERFADDRLPRTSSAIAAIDTSVSAVQQGEFIAHLRHDADLALTMLSRLARTARTNARHMLDLTVGDAVNLVATRVMQLARDPIFAPVREDRSGTIVIEMPLSQQELASWAGVSHRSATGVLEQLREEGLISTSRLHLEIHDPAALATRCVTRPSAAAAE